MTINPRGLDDALMGDQVPPGPTPAQPREMMANEPETPSEEADRRDRERAYNEGMFER